VRRRVESHGLSHAGLVRPANEDHFVVASLQRSVQVRQTNLEDPGVLERLCGPMAYVFAVADGVGGVTGGRMASGLAVASIVEYLSQTVGSYHAVPPGQEHDFLGPLTAAVERAHERLRGTLAAASGAPAPAAGHSAERQGPATTLTLALLVWPQVYLVHVGDSRAYHLRAGALTRLTRDQTMGAYLVARQALSEQQAERAGLNHVLASALGAPDMTPAVGVLDVAPGDVLLLCTDGLTRHVDEAEIAEVLGGAGDAESSCRRLVERALAGGGRDNVTVVVARALAP
jgi:protein phosphatase